MMRRDILARVVEAMVAAKEERHRARTLLRVMATCRELRAVVLTTRALWRHVMVPAAGDVASDTICRFLHVIPRNTVISLTSIGPLPMNHAFLEALEAHGESLRAVSCERQNHTPVPGVGPRWRPAWGAARHVTTLCLTVNIHHAPPMPPLPPLPALQSVCLEVRSGTVAAAPAIIGVQPAMTSLRVHAERRDHTLPPGAQMPTLTVWLAKQPALKKLTLSFLQGDLHDVLRPVCTLPGVTQVDLNVYERPSSYAFARAFPNVDQVAIHIHARPPRDELAPPPPAPPPTPLLAWTKLRVASLKRVPLGPDGGPLRHLTGLEKLHIERCGLTTVEELRPLRKLRYLCARDAVTSLEGVGTLTALTSLTITSPVLDDAGDLDQLTALREIGLDASEWFFPTPWHIPSFTASLETVCVSKYAATVVHDQAVAPMPALKSMYVYGGTMDEVGPLMERGGESQALRRMRWTGTVTPACARRYPRAAAALASTSIKRKKKEEGVA
jgi:hypothetical protein